MSTETRTGTGWRWARRVLTVTLLVVAVIVGISTRGHQPAPTDDPTTVGIVPDAPAPTPTGSATPTATATEVPEPEQDTDDVPADGPVPEPDPVAIADSAAAQAAATTAAMAWWASDQDQVDSARLTGLVTPDAVVADGPELDEESWSTTASVSYVVVVDGSDAEVTYLLALSYEALIPASGDDPAVRLRGSTTQTVTVTRQPDGRWLASSIEEPA